MKKLQVIYAGWGERWPLGVLADTGQHILFEYSPQAHAQALELSPLQAPLAQVGALVGAPCFMGLPGLVADSLPDGWGLLLMDRALRRAGRSPERLSPLERLAFIGRRAMGALIFEPADDVLTTPGDLQLAQLASDAALVLANEDANQALAQLLVLGGSPQGARPKVLVNYHRASGRISSPGDEGTSGDVDSDGEPWLIKFPASQEHRDVCAVEALYTRLAGHCGLEVPASHFFELDGHYSAFGVRRFDRVAGMRVPMQSLSSALHADYRQPTLDYETLLRLTRRLTGDEREVGKAFERCVFNVLSHNRDDHSRNFAYLLDRQRHWKLAPAFDLTFNDGPRGEHFTTIVGEGLAPSRQHLLELARRAAITPRQAASSIDRLCDGMGALAELAKDLPIRKTRLAALCRVLEQDLHRVTKG